MVQQVETLFAMLASSSGLAPFGSLGRAVNFDPSACVLAPCETLRWGSWTLSWLSLLQTWPHSPLGSASENQRSLALQNSHGRDDGDHLFIPFAKA